MTALLFSFGMFGSIFFLTQFLQTVQGLSPLAAGIRVLPWTAMPMLLAPVVGQLAERWGGKPLVVTGLVFQAVGPDLAGHRSRHRRRPTPTWSCPSWSAASA